MIHTMPAHLLAAIYLKIDTITFSSAATKRFITFSSAICGGCTASSLCTSQDLRYCIANIFLQK